MSTPVNDIVDILTAEREEPEWLLPGMFLQGGFYTFVGESGAGKSFLCYTIALAMASGCPALSGIIPAGEPRTILYFDDENSRQDREEYLRRAWKGLQKQNGEEPDLGNLLQCFWSMGSVLGSEEWSDKVAELLVEHKPHACIFDTANACFNIDDENHNAEAGKVIRLIKRLMQTNDDRTTTAIVLKHAKTRTEKGQIRTMRGAKIWKDQSDGVLFQVKATGRPRKDGLSLTRLVPDKKRAYGLRKTIYITPQWTDQYESGLLLKGTYAPDPEHLKKERDDDAE